MKTKGYSKNKLNIMKLRDPKVKQELQAQMKRILKRNGTS